MMAEEAKDGGASYQALFRELEATVQELERSDLPLERAMALFSRGIELSRLLASRLDDAEQKVFRLVTEAGGGFGLESVAGDALGPAEGAGAAGDDEEDGIGDGKGRGVSPRSR
jgi:exodeoxyribonuclease VII small subunit